MTCVRAQQAGIHTLYGDVKVDESQVGGLKPMSFELLLIERRGGRIKCVRTFATPEELHAFLSEYEQRHTSDRERLDQMMRYAETTF